MTFPQKFKPQNVLSGETDWYLLVTFTMITQRLKFIQTLSGYLKTHIPTPLKYYFDSV